MEFVFCFTKYQVIDMIFLINFDIENPIFVIFNVIFIIIFIFIFLSRLSLSVLRMILNQRLLPFFRVPCFISGSIPVLTNLILILFDYCLAINIISFILRISRRRWRNSSALPIPLLSKLFNIETAGK